MRRRWTKARWGSRSRRARTRPNSPALRGDLIGPEVPTTGGTGTRRVRPHRLRVRATGHGVDHRMVRRTAHGVRNSRMAAPDAPAVKRPWCRHRHLDRGDFEVSPLCAPCHLSGVPSQGCAPMSRAFTKEDDSDPPPPRYDLPDRDDPAFLRRCRALLEGARVGDTMSARLPQASPGEAPSWYPRRDDPGRGRDQWRRSTRPGAERYLRHAAERLTTDEPSSGYGTTECDVAVLAST